VPTIEGFRDYARLSPDDDSASIEICFNAAVQHTVDAGVPLWLFDGDGDPKLNLYVYALALNLYDNRGFELPNGVSAAYIQAVKQAMRVELKYRVQPEVAPDG